MGKDYQRRINNKYILPTAVYHRTVWLIRDYSRLLEEYNSIPEEGRSVTDYDGLPHGSPSNNEMISKVIRMNNIKQTIDNINHEKNKIPECYRRGVWNNILYRTRYPGDADKSTYARYKSRFIYNVAILQGYYDDK